MALQLRIKVKVRRAKSYHNRRAMVVKRIGNEGKSGFLHILNLDLFHWMGAHTGHCN